jgi:hypothetical protein
MYVPIRQVAGMRMHHFAGYGATFFMRGTVRHVGETLDIIDTGEGAAGSY